MTATEQIEELQELLREDPENFRARRELAVTLLESGFPKEAAQNLVFLITKLPNDDELYYYLGVAYEKQKLFNRAKESYLKAIELNSANYDSIYNLGLVYIELKDFETAIDCFEQMVSQDINDSNSYFNMGLCYLKMGDLVSSIENFQNTIDINDDDLYAHFYIGNILFEMGLFQDAKDEFKKVIELSPDYSWAYYNLACIAYEENDYEQVSLNLDKTIELNPKDEIAYINYAKLLAKMDLYEEAKTVMYSAAENCANSGQILYYAAQMAKKCGNKDDYIMFLNNALENRDTLEIDVDKVMAELERASV